MTTPSPVKVPGLAAVEKITDPERRAAKAADMLARLEAGHKQRAAAVMAVRDHACRELLDDGRSEAEVGRIIKRTRAAVNKRFSKKGAG